MRRTLLIFLLAFCLVSVLLTTASSTTSRGNDLPAARPYDYWGALAYSYSTGRFGFSYDYPTQAQAINAAVEKCRVRDCRAVVWFHNGCGAFARGTRAWGWGIGDSRAAAEAKALAECRKHGGGCRVVGWACTTR